MSLMKREPWDLLVNFQRSLDDFFGPNALGKNIRGLPKDLDDTWYPAVDVSEYDDHYDVKVDLPGLKSKEVEVTVEQGMLIIKGERKSEKREDKKGYHRIERVQGSFQRMIALPDSADAESVKARMEDGVLNVTINKKQQSSARKISVA